MSRNKKKKSKVLPILIIVVVLVALVLGGFLAFKHLKPKSNKPVEAKVEKVDNIKNYDYSLYKNSTKLYKKYFEELKKVLNEEEINEEEYAKLVAELFVIDFYSLNARITNQDIGGIDFIHTSIRENFSLKATDTIYKYVKSNVYGDRKQALPTVKEITKCDLVKKRYTYTSPDKKTVINDNNAYFVAVGWNYEDNNTKYQRNATITIVHEKENLLSIVSVK